jgi:hypothetical protein
MGGKSPNIPTCSGRLLLHKTTSDFKELQKAPTASHLPTVVSNTWDLILPANHIKITLIL